MKSLGEILTGLKRSSIKILANAHMEIYFWNSVLSPPIRVSLPSRLKSYKYVIAIGIHEEGMFTGDIALKGLLQWLVTLASISEGLL